MSKLIRFVLPWQNIQLKPVNVVARSARLLLLTSALQLFAWQSACAQTQVPYRALHQALAPGLVFAEFDRLIVRQRVRSRISGVTPAKIKIQILSNKGTIDVPIAENGDIRFPMTEPLLAENPLVQSNQAKGSLSLSATMAIKISAARSMRYSDLFEAALQAVSALKRINPNQKSIRVPRVDFFFDEKAEAQLDLVSEKMEQTLIANARGVISLRIDDDLRQQNPEIRFSHPPLVALPHVSN
jgi:hypothetical protein